MLKKYLSKHSEMKSIVVIALITMISIFIHEACLNILILPQAWEGDYKCSYICGNSYDRYEVRKKISISIEEDNLKITMYDSCIQGAYLYGMIGGATVLVSINNEAIIPIENAQHRAIYFNNNGYYMEFILHRDGILWRYCDGTKPEELQDKQFSILMKY